MNNNLSLVNKISLLGLLALLAGTGSGIFFALIFSLTLIITAIIIKLIYSINENFFSQKSGEIILWSTGLGISYLFYILLPQIFESQAQYFNYYFILIGVTPLVHADLKNKNLNNFIINHTLFFDLMLTISILREFLGQGSIFGYQLLFEPPLSIAANAAGAFLILGITALTYETAVKKFNLEEKIKKEMKVDLESEVKS